MKRPSYRESIVWIACNDETAEMDPTAISEGVTTLLVADLFGVEPERVAGEVIAERKKRFKDASVA